MTTELMELNVALAHGLMTVGLLALILAVGVGFLHLCGKLMEKVSAIKFGCRLWHKFNGRQKEFERLVDKIIAEAEGDGIW